MMAEEAQHSSGEPVELLETEPTATAAVEPEGLLDSSGRPIRFYQPGVTGIAKEYYGASRERAGETYARGSLVSEEDVVLTIPRKEFERLNIKTSEVLAEAALAQERMGKDQQEIEELKRETRAMLAALRAA
jgi:hypothetical protein